MVLLLPMAFVLPRQLILELTPWYCRFVVVVVPVHNDVLERERAAARTPPTEIDLSAAVNVDRREDAAVAAERRNAIVEAGGSSHKK